MLDNLKMNAIWDNSEISDKPVFGTLDDEKLEVFQLGRSSMKSIRSISSITSTSTSKRIRFLHGIGQQNITLTNLIKIHSHSDSTSFHVDKYRYDNIILGLHYKESDTITKISFQYPFIWGPFESRNLEDIENESFNPINQIITMDVDTKLKLCQTFNINKDLLELKITQSELFQVEARTGMTLEDIMKYMVSLNHFFRLCMGKIIFPKHISGLTTKRENFKFYPFWLIKYHQNNKFENPSIADEHIIPYQDIKEGFESIIKKWIQLWFKTTEIINDFFNIEESTMSLNTMFTEHTNVLQRFHDKLESTPMCFRRKIDWFLSFCPQQIKDDISKDDFIDKIVCTRNYNVHGTDRKTKFIVKEGQELFYLTRDLKTITEIFLISQLPIQDPIPIMEKIHRLNNYARTHPIE